MGQKGKEAPPWFEPFKKWFAQLGEDTNPTKYEKAFAAGWEAAINSRKRKGPGVTKAPRK